MTSEATSGAGVTIGGRFRVERRLARGGSGEVFLALDESTGKRVALKRLLQTADRTSALSFMREFHALSGLRHPRIIEVYDYGVDNGAPYYTMELLEGHDLGELSPLPYREACALLRDVASSLALLHARRQLHRDVSPRNVRRTRDGRCKLIDFGAMIPFGTPPNLVGTPPYLAPEALLGAPLDQSSDLYSLGAVAYYTLTGRHAFPVHELSELPAVWRQGVPALGVQVPPALEELILALLSADPARRPASAAEVIERLSAVAELAAEDDGALGRGVLASTPLLGRTPELARLDQRIKKAKAKQGSALLITGDAGVGRTRMLTEASLLAQTHGMCVVRLALRERRGQASSLLHELISGLSQVAPKEAERAAATQSLPLTAASTLSQVASFVGEVCSQQPLLITFDDVHYGSNQDAALIVALAQLTGTHPLMLIASRRGAAEIPIFESFSALSASLPLAPLDRTQIAMLTAALFGDVPNVQSTSEFLFRTGHGNPKLTLDLAERLLSRGILRYEAGSWVLPDEINEPMPPDVAQTLLLRLESVGTHARALASLLCVRRRGARMEQLIELAAPLTAADVFQALEELVGAGVLESSGDEYAFIEDGLRSALGRALPQAESQAAHLRWASYLLEHTPTEDDRLEAGWHLTHTEEELRGAELLADIGPALVYQRTNMQNAIPAIERALEVYERHDKSLGTRLHLRSLLVVSSYLYDYRLAERYGDQILDQLYPFTGLAAAERCGRWLGKRAGLLLGVGIAIARWFFSPRHARGPHPVDALKHFSQAAMGIIGLRALETRDVSDVFARLEIFAYSPHPALSMVYMMARTIWLNMRGNAAGVRHSLDDAMAWLKRVPISYINQHERDDLEIGLYLMQGMNETWREGSRALEAADKLDRFKTHYATACSLRIRMTYYLMRGETAQAHHHRRLLELNAIENGCLWQVVWLAVPLEGMAGSTWQDLVAIRRALARLDQIVPEAPGLARSRDDILVAYHFRRGDYEAATKLGDSIIQNFPPMTRIGWTMVYGLTALAHAYAGRAARALEISERGLAGVSAEDREYFVLYTPLEAAYATALALTGQPEKSRQVFQDRIERLQNAKDFPRAVVMHHFRAGVARLTGDRDALRQALEDMRVTAADSFNPAAIALAQRLSETRSMLPDAPRLNFDGEDLDDFGDETKQIAERALRQLCQETDSSEGYLYTRSTQGLQLTAAAGNSTPPQSFATGLAALPANDTRPYVELTDGYSAYTVKGGLVVLRCAASKLPDSLRAELERSLARRAS